MRDGEHTIQVEVRLTAREVNAAAEALGQAAAQLAQADLELEGAKDRRKKKLEERDHWIDVLRRRRQLRSVTVVDRVNAVDGVVESVDVATGQVVVSRPASEDDLQMRLGDLDGDDEELEDVGEQLEDPLCPPAPVGDEPAASTVADAVEEPVSNAPVSEDDDGLDAALEEEAPELAPHLHDEDDSRTLEPTGTTADDAPDPEPRG